MSAIDEAVQQYRSGKQKDARAELAKLRARVAAQAAIIKEQEQDIENITRRESVVVDNYQRTVAALQAQNADQARRLEEARELLMSLNCDGWTDEVDAWLSAPAPQAE